MCGMLFSKIPSWNYFLRYDSSNTYIIYDIIIILIMKNAILLFISIAIAMVLYIIYALICLIDGIIEVFNSILHAIKNAADMQRYSSLVSDVGYAINAIRRGTFNK